MKIEMARTEQGYLLHRNTIEDVDLALKELVLTGENFSRACRNMKSNYNIDINNVTLKRWATTSFPSRYLDIQHNLHRNVDEITKQKISANALLGADVQNTLLERTSQRLDEEVDISVKDLANAYSSITNATERNLKTKLLLEDKPTQIVEVRSVEQAIKELVDDDVLIDAEVVEEEYPPALPNSKAPEQLPQEPDNDQDENQND